MLSLRPAICKRKRRRPVRILNQFCFKWNPCGSAHKQIWFVSTEHTEPILNHGRKLNTNSIWNEYVELISSCSCSPCQIESYFTHLLCFHLPSFILSRDLRPAAPFNVTITVCNHDESLEKFFVSFPFCRTSVPICSLIHSLPNNSLFLFPLLRSNSINKTSYKLFVCFFSLPHSCWQNSCCRSVLFEPSKASPPHSRFLCRTFFPLFCFLRKTESGIQHFSGFQLIFLVPWALYAVCRPPPTSTLGAISWLSFRPVCAKPYETKRMLPLLFLSIEEVTERYLFVFCADIVSCSCSGGPCWCLSALS